MSINSITAFGSYQAASGCQLSEETKQKLKALGIDPTTVTSEAQAKLLIANAMQQKQAVNKTENTDSKTVNCSESEILSKAKALAAKVGVNVSANATIEDILTSISSKISTMASVTNRDNSSKCKEAQQLQSELYSLQSEYGSVKQTQNSMYTMLNMTANMNKYMLGL